MSFEVTFEGVIDGETLSSIYIYDSSLVEQQKRKHDIQTFTGSRPILIQA